MPEFVQAQRGFEKLCRVPHRLKSGPSIGLNFSPWPFLACLSFTFDCEGTYGGGSSFRGETDVVPDLATFFADIGIKATFNFVGKIAEEYPEVVKTVFDAQQDLGGHGYSHTFLDELTTLQQEQEVQNTIAIIKDATQHQLIGWRSPYGIFTPHLYMVLEKMGFSWTSNFGRSLWGDMPFRVQLDNTLFNIVDIPFDDVHFDSWIYGRHNIDPDQAHLLYINHVRQAVERGSIFTILNHPVNLAEDIRRVDVIKRTALSALEMGDIWVASSTQIAERWRLLQDVKIGLLSFIKKGAQNEVSISVENLGKHTINDLAIHMATGNPVSKVQGWTDWMALDPSKGSPFSVVLKMPSIGPNKNVLVDFQITS